MIYGKTEAVMKQIGDTDKWRVWRISPKYRRREKEWPNRGGSMSSDSLGCSFTTGLPLNLISP
jgi:hypothetical protein